MIKIKNKFKTWETNDYLIEGIVQDIWWEKIIDENFENKLNLIIENIIKLTKKTKLIKKFSISVLFTGDKKITQLNKKFRKINSATNILSFPATQEYINNNNPIASYYNDLNFLGDIVISCDTVIEEAKRDKIIISNHLIHLFIHSILHLLGYDHESCHDAEIMEILEIKILKNMNIENPYAKQFK